MRARADPISHHLCLRHINVYTILNYTAWDQFCFLPFFFYVDLKAHRIDEAIPSHGFLHVSLSSDGNVIFQRAYPIAYFYLCLKRQMSVPIRQHFINENKCEINDCTYDKV